MKAAVHTRYGPPEVVQIKEVNKPEPGEKEVLVKVHFATVNRTDCGFRSAEYFVSRFFSGLFKPKQQTLGNEFSGVVEKVGKNTTRFQPGDRVFGYDDKKFACHAEYKLMSEEGAIDIIPANLSFEEAAPLLEGAHYALCDIRAAKLKPGSHVLVYGGSGAIGSAAIQILKSMNMFVMTVCGTKNTALVKSLGADVVVDYQTQDFTDTDLRFDLVFDAVGKSSFKQCKAIMKENSLYISTELGKNGDNVWRALYGGIFKPKKRVLFPLPVISKEDTTFFRELAQTGKFKPVIDRTYPLENIVQAYKYVETAQKTGNVLIQIA